MTENTADFEPDMKQATPPAQPGNRPVATPRLDAFFSIPVTLELVLASMKMPVSKLMDVQVGSEIDLDHPAGTEVALVVNGNNIAFGHLFLIDQTSRRVGVRISRLATSTGDN